MNDFLDVLLFAVGFTLVGILIGMAAAEFGSASTRRVAAKTRFSDREILDAELLEEEKWQS